MAAGTITLSQAATATAAGVALDGRRRDRQRAAQRAADRVTLGANTTGGTFTLTYATPNPSNTTATATAIPFNATPAELQAKLSALSNIGAGNVSVSSPNPGGGASPGGPYTVEFQGTRFADTNVNQMTSSATGLTVSGGTKSAAVATVREGASAAEICTVATECQAGIAGTGPGQFGAWQTGSYVAVDAANVVYVVDNNRIQKFNQSGVFQSAISLPGEGFIRGLAIDSAGDLYTISQTLPAVVRKLDPAGNVLCSLEGEVEGEVVPKAPRGWRPMSTTTSS